MSGENTQARKLLIDDGRIGHFRQVQALAGELPGESEVYRLNLRQPWRALAPWSLPYGMRYHPELQALVSGPAPRVVIGCGRRSSLILQWLGAAWKPHPATVQVLHCGRSADHFSWVITPLHDGLYGRNVIRTIGSLNPISDDWLAAANAPSGLKVPRIGLLLGGPTRHLRWSRQWLASALERLLPTLRELRASILLVTGPRTPDWGIEVVQQTFSGVPLEINPWIADGQPVSIQAYARVLAQASHLIVTADSVNQASEACASGKPVFFLGADLVRGRIARFVRKLLVDGYVLPLGSSGAGLRDAIHTGAESKTLREVPKVAEILLKSGMFD